MFLSVVSFAKSKSKTILVKMMSQAGTGFSFNTKRSRLREKLTLLHYDPVGPSPTGSLAFKPWSPMPASYQHSSTSDAHCCFRSSKCHSLFRGPT
ncbi:large ribosomal subunit protein bL33m isoform X1 [Diceros bicornis minor]|uniref:large ribosomal subunit protein bL33m isoform X1 n=1 Tax=Diceros bicornis minor TaxID=77932 RepID=UPI0026F23969|nr:large ribosomal subunit protein bL33m isoform X1 [Diceros bicornis minor]